MSFSASDDLRRQFADRKLHFVFCDAVLLEIRLKFVQPSQVVVHLFRVAAQERHRNSRSLEVIRRARGVLSESAIDKGPE